MLWARKSRLRPIYLLKIQDFQVLNGEETGDARPYSFVHQLQVCDSEKQLIVFLS